MTIGLAGIFPSNYGSKAKLAEKWLSEAESD